MKLDLTICRADEVVGLIKKAELMGTPFDGVISIEHPGVENLSATFGRAPRLVQEIGPQWQNKQIILICYDVEHPHFGFPVPPESVVTDSLSFIDSFSSLDRPVKILVHCRNGECRSPALAIVALLHADKRPEDLDSYNEKLLRIRPIAAPNIVIINHGDRLLGYQGRLVKAIEGHAEFTEARAAVERRRVRVFENQDLRDRLNL